MKQYINLTAGLEHISHLSVAMDRIHFVRIQSSHLETKHFWKVIQDVDIGFLIDLFTQGVMFRDASAQKKESRAIFQGLPWIIYAVQRTAVGANYPLRTMVRNMNVEKFFDDIYYLRHLVAHGKKWQSISESKAREAGLKKLKYVCDLLGEKVFYPKYQTDCIPSLLDGLVERDQYGKVFLGRGLVQSQKRSEDDSFDMGEEFTLQNYKLAVAMDALSEISNNAPSEEPPNVIGDYGAYLGLGAEDYANNGANHALWNVKKIADEAFNKIEAVDLHRG